jgi:hypothetical protein
MNFEQRLDPAVIASADIRVSFETGRSFFSPFLSPSNERIRGIAASPVPYINEEQIGAAKSSRNAVKLAGSRARCCRVQQRGSMMYDARCRACTTKRVPIARYPVRFLPGLHAKRRTEHR